MKCSSRKVTAKDDGYLAGLRHGKTMAEVDVYYTGLLKELKELQKIVDSDLAHSSQEKDDENRDIPENRKSCD